MKLASWNVNSLKVRLPQVLDLYYVAGSHDFLLHVAVRDVDHLRRLVAERVSSHEAIGHVETSLVFEHQHRPQWPDFSEPDPEPANDKAKPRAKPKPKRAAPRRR